MTYLVDTNVLVRLLVPADPLHPQARATVRKLARKGEAMCVAVQNPDLLTYPSSEMSG